MKQLISLLLLLTSTASYAAVMSSAYTDLSTCKTLTTSENDPEAPIDYFTSVCAGRDGFAVRLDGGDLRSWISLADPKTGQILTENITNAEYQGQFPNVAASKIEWIYKEKKLSALIVRMSSQDPEDYNKELVNLTVIRVNKENLSKTCVVGVVNAKQSGANEKARVVAANKTSCLY